MQIKTKEEFNRLSQAGKLGNFLRTWGTLRALRASGYCGWITIQSKDKQSPYFVPWAHTGLGGAVLVGAGLAVFPSVENEVRDLLDKGARREQMYFREVPAPDARRTIQFEAMLGPQWQGGGAGVELCYELDSVMALRGIRERGKNVSGCTAQLILRRYLSPASYEALHEIWGAYPDSIIEFTEFSKKCGKFGEHGVFWEVRDF